MYDIAEDPGDGNAYTVRFKRGTRAFLLARSCERSLTIGDYVKVEADRGEDLGVVVAIAPLPEAGAALRPPTAGHAGRGSSGGGGAGGVGGCERERILRGATDEEIAVLKEKMADEERVLAVCRAKVVQRGLPMEVMDAEFQYDRHKLTFYFQADGRIDFRELVRDLFALYKTRIW
ncbi:PSP1 C-terminal conserved region-domain-containing protein [Tribonema minus]|uniref:PSP1 C-terminal conserved region-domain-containing protein n=1 Tax=Tribonema minus TaxID=303371 RepID=A0A835ZJM0_9STRA|nr:PSP1 C-terminal conserved region-domain-containing protein [Tribonema minus]